MPHSTLLALDRNDYEVSDSVSDYAKSDTFIWVVYLTTCFGSLLSFTYLLHFFISVGRKFGYIENPDIYRDQNDGIINRFSTSSHVIGTARTKRAATRKVNSMLTNARSMHGRVFGHDTAETIDNNKQQRQKDKMGVEAVDAVFQNFTLRGERTVKAGSLFWTWQKIRSGELFDEEGIWLPSRLIIFQVGQVVIGIFFSAVMFYVVEQAAREADRATAELKINLSLGNRYPEWVIDMVPTGNEVRGALLPSASIAVCVCFMLIIIYLPR